MPWLALNLEASRLSLLTSGIAVLTTYPSTFNFFKFLFLIERGSHKKLTSNLVAEPA